MANVVTKIFQSGYRLFDGKELNDAFSQLNRFLAGTLAGTLSILGTITASGNLITASFLNQSAAAGLTATGTTRTDALALTKAINVMGTVASGTGVVLPPASTVGVGGSVIIFNDGASVLQVYGAGTNTIDGVAGATGVALTNARRAQFYVTAAGVFKSALLGVVST